MEVQSILEKAGEKFWDACRAAPAGVPLRDSNGNSVGSITVTE